MQDLGLKIQVFENATILRGICFENPQKAARHQSTWWRADDYMDVIALLLDEFAMIAMLAILWPQLHDIHPCADGIEVKSLLIHPDLHVKFT